MSKPRTRVRVDFTVDCSLGPGKIALLEGIDRSGSLSAAARDLGMSYRRAWLLLHTTNDAFLEPVVELAVGGKDGGGARLTAFGRHLVDRFREFEAEVDELAARRLGDLQVSGRAAPGQGIARKLAQPRPPARTRMTGRSGRRSR